MVKLGQNRKKQIALKRIRFFYQEVAWGFIIVFVFLLIPLFIVPLIVDESSPLYGILTYSLRAIIIFIGIPLTFPLSNLIFESRKRNLIIEEDISPAIGHLKLYKMTKNNYKYQILYGILIFFLVLLPIDFFINLLIPELIKYQGDTLANKSTEIYLSLDNYFLFLISLIIIQFSVSVSEETIFRGLITKRGSEHFFKMSVVMIASLSWGLRHFVYFLDPISRFYPFWYPLVFLLQTFIVGIVLSLFILRKKWIFPVIIAHTLNNLISGHVIWMLIQGIDFTSIILNLYYPLIIVGCILFVWYYSQIKESLSMGLKMFKTYFKFDNTSEDTKGDTIFRVFFDILMGFLIFIIGFMIMV